METSITPNECSGVTKPREKKLVHCCNVSKSPYITHYKQVQQVSRDIRNKYSLLVVDRETYTLRYVFYFSHTNRERKVITFLSGVTLQPKTFLYLEATQLPVSCLLPLRRVPPAHL